MKDFLSTYLLYTVDFPASFEEDCPRPQATQEALAETETERSGGSGGGDDEAAAADIDGMLDRLVAEHGARDGMRVLRMEALEC